MNAVQRANEKYLNALHNSAKIKDDKEQQLKQQEQIND